MGPLHNPQVTNWLLELDSKTGTPALHIYDSKSKPSLKTQGDFLCHSWLHGRVVECWSLTGELSLSCDQPTGYS